MQNGGDRQILTTDRTVDDDLQAFDGSEDVHRSPIATCAVVI
jgi:hypothetical protein